MRGKIVAMIGLLAGVWAVPVAAQVKPNARYQTLETAHFRVTFGPGLERLAERTADVAERTRAMLLELTVEPAGKVDIVLVDDVDFSNGFANVFPSNRVVLYARPPIDEEALSYNADWLDLVVSHELVHIYHLDRAGLLGRALRKVFGRLPLVFPLFPAVATPEWSTEGLAVTVESAFTGFGRLHGTHHEMVVRTAALAGELDRMDRLNESSPIWPGDGRVYIYGSLFMHWLAERYGDDVHGRLLDRTASAVLPPFLFFDRVATNAFGASFDEAYAAWRADVERAAMRLADSLRAQGLTTSDRLTTHPRRALYPRVSPDGQRLVYTAEDGRDSPETRILETATGRELESHRRNGIGAQSWTRDGRLVVSQFEFQNPYQIWSDLFLVGPAGRRLTDGLRLQDAHVAPDGDRIVAIQNDNGSARLVLGRISTGEFRTVTAADPDVLWSFPRWSPDGDRIAATRWHRGGTYEIVIADTMASVQRTVIRGPDLHLSPAWSPDGRWLLFSSDRTGITNLYAADLSSAAPELRQVTNVLTGAFQPEVSPDQRWIYFAGYHASGYAIERMPFAPATWRTPSAARPRIAEGEAGVPRDGTAQAQQALRPYSPWRSLLPKAWQPVLLTGAGRYGGITIAGEDLIGRHSFGAFAAVHLGGEARWQGAASYRFARLGNPVLTLDGSRFWDDLGQIRLPDSTFTSVLEREDQLGALLTFSRRRWRNSASVSIGVERERLLRSLEDAPANVRLRDVEDVQLGLLARASFSATRVPLYAVSREDGFSISVSGKRSVESERTVFRDSTGSYPADYNEGRALMTAYKSLPFGGFAHQVLALRASGYWSDGPGASLSGLGGSTGSVSSILGFELTSGTRLLPVRGFEPSALAGTRAWSASAEWRIPLALVGRRPALSPFFIDRVAGALFADAGDAWCTAEEQARSSRCRFAESVATPIAAAGAELAIDMGFAGIFTARLRGGVGFPFRGPGDRPRFYVELGSNY